MTPSLTRNRSKIDRRFMSLRCLPAHIADGSGPKIVRYYRSMMLTYLIRAYHASAGLYAHKSKQDSHFMPFPPISHTGD
jgi:hypothetical protein